MLSVATWNLENLFRPAANANAARRQVYEDKLDGLAAAINGLGLDVLAVQEVGDPGAMEDLRDRLTATGMLSCPSTATAWESGRLSLALYRLR
jgi:hypothetical protein